MKPFIAFTKKEIHESFKTKKIIVLAIVLIFLAILSPATALLMPDIVKMALPEGMKITINDPTVLDSWQQFFKNMEQMGLIILVIMYSGMLVSEIRKGTLINLITKGLNRVTIVVSKFVTVVLIWTVLFWASFGVTFAYNSYYWPDGEVTSLVFAACCLWFAGIMLMSLVILFSTIFNGIAGVLAGTGSVVAVFFLLNILPAIEKINPIRLMNDNFAVINGTMDADKLILPLTIGILVTICSLCIACIAFYKKRL